MVPIHSEVNRLPCFVPYKEVLPDRAMLLTPQDSETHWEPGAATAPSLAYDFQSSAGDAEVLLDMLPAFRIYPGTQLRISVSVDRQPPQILEAPGSNGAENENGPIRSAAVQDNYGPGCRLPG